jgi:hypothetical protein
MGDVLRFEPRAKLAPELVSQDQWGRRMFAFEGSYTVDGRSWAARFWAFDHDHAEACAAAMGGGLRDIGQVIEEGNL